MTADGRLVHASEEDNTELFWGLRGAGANYGIATSFEFRLHPLDPVITHGAVLHPIERAGELAARFRDAVDGGPDELWLSFYLGLALPAEDFPPEVAGGPVAVVSVLHCGPLEQAERDLAPLRAFGPPLVDSIQAKPYLAAQLQNDEAMRWGRRFYMKSAFLPGLPDELVEQAVEHMPRVRGRTARSSSAPAAAHREAVVGAAPEDALGATLEPAGAHVGRRACRRAARTA